METCRRAMGDKTDAVASKYMSLIQDASASQEPRPSQLEGRQENILKNQDMIIGITRISILQNTNMSTRSYLNLLHREGRFLREGQSQDVEKSLTSR